MANDLLMEPGTLLERACRLRDAPVVLVHARQDFSCLIGGAYALYRRWADSRFYPVKGPGNSPFEPGMARAFVAAKAYFLNGGTLKDLHAPH